MKISVITVCYNSFLTLERTILSVIGQTYHNIEYIIIDGGSTDGTIDIIKKYENYISYWVSEPDEGIYDAMNKGITRATGEYIGIINSDDWYEIDTFEKVVKYFCKNPDYQIVCGDILVHVYIGREEIIKRVESKPLMEYLKKNNTIMHPTVFANKKFYASHGLFNTKYKIVADYDIFLRSILRKEKLGYIPSIMAHFSGGGCSSNMVNTTLELIKVRYENKLPLLDQCLYDLRDLINLLQSYIMRLLPKFICIKFKEKQKWEIVKGKNGDLRKYE